MADIQGLEHFANYFSDVSEMFVIVGGVASALLMEDAGEEFRPTKDIDLVIVANPSTDLTTKLKKYIDEAGYKIQEKDGKESFYRFREPKNTDYPKQVEIFSNNPGGITLLDGQHIIPVETAPEVGRLSAILLEEEYFQLIKDNRTQVGKHSIATQAAIIPLKARAYNDIKAREGLTSEAKKHRNDIMKLALSLNQDEKHALGTLARTHMEGCLADLSKLPSTDFNNVMRDYPQAKSVEEIIKILRDTFL